MAAEPYTFDEQTLQRRSVSDPTLGSSSIKFGIFEWRAQTRNWRIGLKEFAVPEEAKSHHPHASISQASAGNELMTRPRRVAVWLAERFRGLPPWMLLAQFFLATGWQRAAITHGVDSQWWDGTVVMKFVDDHRSLSIDWYQATMLDGLVTRWPVAICVVVVVVQAAIGLMLIFNARPLLALALGAGLNINFALAGAVNPSIFYLIIGAVLALWHVEASVAPARTRKLVSVSTLVAAAALGALLPEIATLDPAHVIDDPAIVLSFAALLWVGALRVDLTREPDQAFRPRWRDREGDDVLIGSGLRPGGGVRPTHRRETRCERTR